MFAGTTISIEGKEYIIPSLSLGQLRNGSLAMLREHDKLIADGNAFDAMELRGKIILSALKRNYPDFDEKMLFDFLDMRNIGDIWNRVLGGSGFTLGEETAATATINGTSSPSTEA